MNIMFMGDFLQFPPITDTPFYSTNIQPTFAFSKQTPLKNHSLWENHICLNNIILTEQMRQNKNIQYAYVLEHLKSSSMLHKF